MRKRQLFWLICCLCFVFGAVLAAEAATYPINYTLTAAGKVSINVYDANGKIVRELLHAVPRASGANQEIWDGLDRTGAALPAGSYSWKMLCTPGLAAEFVMNLGGNYTQTGTFGTSDPPGNHGGVGAIVVDATGVYMGAGCAENVSCGAKVALDGTLLWKLPSPTAYQGYIAMASANGVLFALTSDTRLQKFSPSTGSLIASYTSPAGAKKIDAYGTNLAVVTGSAVTWIDQTNGTTLDTAPITSPNDLAIAADGTVYLISGTSVVTVTRANHTPVTVISGLTSPTCIDIDHSTGDILLFEAGTSQRVKRYSATGTLITTYGTAGGRVDGLYQSTNFFNITDLISDGAGGFYIAEPANAPRRVTHFNSGGAVMKEWYGGQIWAPFITVEPDDPTVVWMASHWGYWMRLTLNYTTKTWEVHSTYNFANLGNGIIRQGCNDDTWVARVHNGTTYLCRIRYGTPFVVKVDETNWRLLPVAVAESIRSDTPSNIKTWAGSNGAYSWVDQNGDGSPQQAECTFFQYGLPDSLTSSVDSNMNYILMQNGNRRIATYPVTSWNAVGAPVYGNLPSGQQVGAYPARFTINGSAWPAFCYHDVTNNEYYGAVNADPKAWGFARDAFMIKWNSAGSEVWEAGEGCGNNYGSPRGKVGAFRSFPGGTHGCVIAMDYNGG